MEIPFTDTISIALIVRGKCSADHHPSLDDQHADCILSDGAPVGFFGDHLQVGVGIAGKVFTYSDFASQRPYYVALDSAQAKPVVSGILRVNVSSQQAQDFCAVWRAMQADPGSFGYIGNNCSTHAARAFARTGIIGPEIPGLDTPDNLYAALKAAMPNNVTEYFGFLYFTPISSAMTEMDQSFMVQYETAPYGTGGGGSSSIGPSGLSGLSASESAGSASAGDFEPDPFGGPGGTGPPC
jgi:hypothetical protein